ncbi:WbqC family protein [Zooshikella harenae]|uniref:WbqC family protein n=1 Tax=Zooshikella harenae TaxID=2827238 RepID=A0ABS5ZBN3_9GAMM|nr:WbqC family protein [Zooshikella harenae]MBU2711168.1 WbqC family protein [Zooshikella harenae]
MKTIAIMQPYWLPYIGYWQLIHAVDEFVLYDTVTYIKQGWINRNKFIVNGHPQWVTLSIKQASSHTLIKDIVLDGNKQKVLKTLIQSYAHTPYINQIKPVLCECLEYSSNHLVDYLHFSLNKILTLLNIKKKVIRASTIKHDMALQGETKVIDICRQLNAHCYINMLGGCKLYNSSTFKANGIKLLFLEKKPFYYNQYNHPHDFIDNLSILDILMNNSVQDVVDFLSYYKLYEQ